MIHVEIEIRYRNSRVNVIGIIRSILLSVCLITYFKYIYPVCFLFDKYHKNITL